MFSLVGNPRKEIRGSLPKPSRLNIFLLAILLAGSISPSVKSDNLHCPGSVQDWIQWRNDLIASLRVRPENLTQSSFQTFLDCRATSPTRELLRNPDFAACFRLLEERQRAIEPYIETRPGHSMRLSISDEEYFNPNRLEYPEQLQVPPTMAGDQEFLRVIGDPRSTREQLEIQARRMARHLPGLRVLEYTSAHIQTLDASSTYGRLLLFVPASRNRPFDQWIQVGRNTHRDQDGASTAANPDEFGQQLSIVSVQTRRRNGTRLLHPQVRFNDFLRMRSPETGRIQIQTRLSQGQRLDSCYSCHYTGVLPIHPDFSSSPISIHPRGSSADLINYLNERVAAYGPFQMDGIDLTNQGPPIGEQDRPTRTNDFLRRCSQGTSIQPAQFPRIRAAMNCVRCHDDQYLPALRFTALKFGPASHSITTGIMPPLSTLSPPERTALRQCLTMEYYGSGPATPRETQPILGTWIESLNSPECDRVAVPQARPILNSNRIQTDEAR